MEILETIERDDGGMEFIVDLTQEEYEKFAQLGIKYAIMRKVYGIVEGVNVNVESDEGC